MVSFFRVQDFSENGQQFFLPKDLMVQQELVQMRTGPWPSMAYRVFFSTLSNQELDSWNYRPVSDFLEFVYHECGQESCHKNTPSVTK